MTDHESARLTAYALGELTDDAERARIEAILAADPTARAEVERTRQLAALLTDELAKEELPAAPALKMPRRRWPFRLAVAAAAAAVVGGAAFAVLGPDAVREKVAATRDTWNFGRPERPLIVRGNEHAAAYPRPPATEPSTNPAHTESVDISTQPVVVAEPPAPAPEPAVLEPVRQVGGSEQRQNAPTPAVAEVSQEADKRRAAQLVEQARAEESRNNLSGARQLYTEATTIDAQNAAAVAGRDRIAAVMDDSAHGGGLLSRDGRLIDAQQQEIVYSFNTSVDEARRAMSANEFVAAQASLDRARVARNTNPNIFSEAQLRDFDTALANSQTRLDQGRREFEQQQAVQQQTSVAMDIRRARESQDADRSRTVGQLQEQERRLKAEGRQAEAAGVREQIAVLTGKDDQNVFPNETVVEAGRNVETGIRGEFAVESDINGGVANGGPVYDDGHAEFQRNPFGGARRDNIWTKQQAQGQQAATGGADGLPGGIADATPQNPTRETAGTRPARPVEGGLLSRQTNLVNAQQQELAYSFQASCDEARSAIARRDFAAAQAALDRARVARNTNPILFAEGQMREFDGQLERVQNELTAVRQQFEPSNTESYDRVVDNPFLAVVQNPLSTFSIDVDTAAYSNVRRFLAGGQLPPKDAVRIEELVNYFPYDYAPPTESDERPFAAHVEVAECPWRPEHRLVRVALKGKEIAQDKRPASNLVFLLDVSGSMNEPNKLPLVQRAMRMLTNELTERDTVTIVVYAGSSGLVLPPTSGAEKQTITVAIDQLTPGGSTNGAQGIQLAYQQAASSFKKDGVNRVILCTDGDFNVGVTSQGDLTRLIEEKAKTGVFLSVLGFGMGNLKDGTMESLADKGNGNYAYIDTEAEAKKVLVEQMNGTLVTIAKDVKVQIEFNPAVASAYRLIGYENRLLAKEDFNDDAKDAGEIGAGHTVTALYEVVPAGLAPPATLPGVDELKYQRPATRPAAAATTSPDAREPGVNAGVNELLTLKLRHKAPDGDKSQLMEVPVTDPGHPFAKASGDFKFAAAVAGFGMLLRESPHKGNATFGAVMEWAGEGVGEDKAGYRKEFVEIVKKAESLVGQ